MSYQAFILEIVEGLTEERILNFYREQNTDDAYTFQEFLPELDDFLNDNYGDAVAGEPNHKHLAHLREHPEEREDIWDGICQDLEEHYGKNENPHMCEFVGGGMVNGTMWGYECEKPAVYCREIGLVYCSEHICDTNGGSWCEYDDCASCNEARRLDAIEEAAMEALHGPAPVD